MHSWCCPAPAASVMTGSGLGPGAGQLIVVMAREASIKQLTHRCVSTEPLSPEEDKECIYCFHCYWKVLDETGSKDDCIPLGFFLDTLKTIWSQDMIQDMMHIFQIQPQAAICGFWPLSPQTGHPDPHPPQLMTSATMFHKELCNTCPWQAPDFSKLDFQLHANGICVILSHRDFIWTLSNFTYWCVFQSSNRYYNV